MMLLNTLMLIDCSDAESL